MEQNKIPTTEDILRSILGCFEFELSEFKEHFPEGVEEAIKIIKEQNKLHVKAALEAAGENCKIQSVNHDYYVIETDTTLYPDESVHLYQVDKDSILNAYSLDLIK